MNPALVIHADWSTSPAKRWLARAVREADGAYTLHAPEPVGDTTTWLARLDADSNSGGVFLGVDFPLGLPKRYAEKAGVSEFRELLPRLGEGEWVDFYDVASTPEEISIHRPFYPARPGGTRRQHLLDGLGVGHVDELRRLCDRGYPGRRAAAPLFWTMGAQQVGKAAIAGWREVLGPALRARSDIFLWPFDGTLAELLSQGRLVVAESYPAEFYGHLGVTFPPGSGGKRDQSARAAQTSSLLAWATTNRVTLRDELVRAMRAGFGDSADGEDRFDAVVGLAGMLNVLLGHRPAGEPGDYQVRRVEGWILGQMTS